jgi:deoxyribose-phosphate aldolase
MNIASYIDHTFLKQTTLLSDIGQLCSEASQYGFAAVCVPPLFVKKAREFLTDSPVKLATVIGFPLGYSAIEAKLAELVLAIVDGADELDIVVNISAIKNKDWQFLANEINTLLPVARNKQRTVKIIIESGVLSDEEISTCCDVYAAAGVDFIKTSTGFAEKGASIETVRLLRKILPSNIRIKASGGIKTYAFASGLIAAGADRLGCSNSVAIINEAAGSGGVEQFLPKTST